MPPASKINEEAGEEVEAPPRVRITTPMRLVLEHMLKCAQKIYGRGLCQTLGMECSGMYRVLHELERRKWLESFWDHSTSQGRKYYQLTDIGRRITEDLVTERGALIPCA